MIRILEAASASIKMQGAPVTFSSPHGAAPALGAAKAEELVQAEAFTR
jgi:hypothetical protein